MRWLSRLFCWQRCDRLLREIHCFPAAIVKGRRAVVCPAQRRRRRPPSLGLRQLAQPALCGGGRGTQ